MGDLGSIPGLGRSPGEGKGYPLQDSGLENSRDCPWGRKELDTPSDFHFPFPMYMNLLNLLLTDKLDLKHFVCVFVCVCELLSHVQLFATP